MRMRTVLVVFLLLLAPGLSGASASALSPGSPKGPDPYWPYDGNGGTNALHYDVRVAYNFAAKVLRGRTTITMRANQELSSFSLDLLVPASAVKVNGRTARFSRPNRHELKVVPAAPVANGATFKVEVVYRGKPAALSYDGERNWLADGNEVVTMNEPHMAPWWFPSNDHPSDKATFDFHVNVAKTKRVLSNGVRVSKKVGRTRATTHWRMSDPMTTYLAFFAAGDFAVETGRTPSGTPYYNAVSRHLSKSEFASSTRVLRKSARITDWLENWLGEYPFTSTGGLVTSLDVGFALENQTRPTYGPWIYTSVVVHELAHQWFGDSVAVQRWSDIWINEGFATYAEAYFDSLHGGPSTNAWLNQQYNESCRSQGMDLWQTSLRNPGADRIFDGAVYERGGMALAALSNRIGATKMRSLLRTWVATHRDGNATVAQFEALAESHTGEDLGGFFDAWLGGGGKPPLGTAENGLDHVCR